MARLTEEHIEALAGALSLAARVGGSYEVYGGVDVTKAISAGNEAVEILQDSRIIVTPKGQKPDEPTVPAEAVDTGNMPAAEPAPVVITPRMMCRSCEKFLGYSHQPDCEFDGVVLSAQCEEKWTTLENSEEQPDPIPLLLPVLPDQIYAFTGEELTKLLTEAGGVASVPWMMANPDQVFPSEEVLESIQALAIESAPLFRDAFLRAGPVRKQARQEAADKAEGEGRR